MELIPVHPPILARQVASTSSRGQRFVSEAPRREGKHWSSTGAVPNATLTALTTGVIFSHRGWRRNRVKHAAQAAAASLILDDGWDDEPEGTENVPLSKKAPLLIDGNLD
eukprot:symbB.v1.2.002481.t1/scaffold131.1/size310497/1